MKKPLLLAAILAAPAAFAAGRATSAPPTQLSPGTRADLDTAMHGEAFASAKYLAYAASARAHGNEQLARLFEEAAQTERTEHFKEEATLAGTVGSDADNLREAIRGETYEASSMYPEFAQRAEKAGDASAAARFREIARDEAKHRDAFKAQLDQLERGNR